MHERLIELLRSQAVEDHQGWMVETSHDFVTVRATVEKTASDRQGAWELANEFCDAVLDLGYELSGSPSLIIAESTWRAECPAWQGRIELRVTPVKGE